MCGVHSYLVDHSYYHTLQVLTYGTPLLSSTVDEFQALENDPEYQKMTQQVHIIMHYTLYTYMYMYIILHTVLKITHRDNIMNPLGI